MSGKLFNTGKNPLNKPGGGIRFIQCNIVRNAVKVLQCGFGPDYFNHRRMRVLACR